MTQRKPIFVDTVKNITGKDAPAFTFIHRIYEQKHAFGFIPYRVLCREQTFLIPVDTLGFDQEVYEATLGGLRDEWNSTQQRRISAHFHVAALSAKETLYWAESSK